MLFSRQLPNGSHDFFQTFSMFYDDYFSRIPQTTIALRFLTHNISPIGGVSNIKMLKLLVKNFELNVICKISNFNMWTAKHFAQASCTTLQSLTGKLQGRIASQGDPCSHYREWVYRVKLSSVLVTFLSLFSSHWNCCSSSCNVYRELSIHNTGFEGLL